jgi:hypothetical protein
VSGIELPFLSHVQQKRRVGLLQSKVQGLRVNLRIEHPISISSLVMVCRRRDEVTGINHCDTQSFALRNQGNMPKALATCSNHLYQPCGFSSLSDGAKFSEHEVQRYAGYVRRAEVL